MSVQFRDGKTVGGGYPPYIVAEVNSSHNGSMEAAKRMIDAAVEAGCDCVKFQSFTEDSLYSKSYYAENPIAKRFVSKFSFGEDKLLECAEYCKQKGVAFASTPYSLKEADFLLERCDIPFMKVASMEMNNLPFLQYIAGRNIPIVLSTGMADEVEIEAAINTTAQTGNHNLVLLHCVSAYPCELDAVNLRNIAWLQAKYPQYPIGYSDHTLGYEIAPAAVAMGASLIEKHLTLDHTKIGMDNQMATEPDDMALMVKYCHSTYKALGRATREISEAELEQREKMRRSLVYTRDLKAGTTLKADDIDAKRPGTGILPTERDIYVEKTLTKDVVSDTLMSTNDFI